MKNAHIAKLISLASALAIAVSLGSGLARAGGFGDFSDLVQLPKPPEPTPIQARPQESSDEIRRAVERAALGKDTAGSGTYTIGVGAREIHRNTQTYSYGGGSVTWTARFVQKSTLTYSFVYEWDFVVNGIRYRGNRHEVDLGHPSRSGNPFVQETFVNPSNAAVGVHLFVDFDYSGFQRSACQAGGHAVGLIAKHYFRSLVGNVPSPTSEIMRVHFEIDMDKKHTSASGDGCAQLRDVNS